MGIDKDDYKPEGHKPAGSKPEGPKPDARPVADLPRWDLSDLFPAHDTEAFETYLKDTEKAARAFSKTFKGHVARLSGLKLAEAITEYEKINMRIERVQAYAMLAAAVNPAPDAVLQNAEDRVLQADNETLFLKLEVNKLSEGDLLDRLDNPELAHYSAWLRNVRSMRGHLLDEDLETYLSKKKTTASDAWYKLYTQTMADMRFKVGGKSLTEAEIYSRMNYAAESKERRAAYDAYGATLGDHAAVFLRVMNAVVDLRRVEDGMRKFDTPDAHRHVDNQIEPDIVKIMSGVVRGSYSKTTHRYYAWKARKFGVARLHPADRNAPLPGSSLAPVPWEKAKTEVVAAYAKVSKEMGEIAQKFFDNNWIDAAPREGKEGGAFSHPTVADVHPYIMMSYFGTREDVQTLAHELGHGIHQTLAGKAQGHLKSQMPLTLEETASVFGEAITFRALFEKEEDLFVKRALLAGHIEDMLDTVNRQTAYYTFEQRLHEKRREEGELLQEDISRIWLETQRESLGPAVNLDVPGTENHWMNVPHFLDTQFYVYSYAFGQLLVNALFDEYATTDDKEAFVEKYTDMLKAGGTKRHQAALAPFGFDTTDPDFWQRGISVIERHIDEIEALDARIHALLASKKDFRTTADDLAAPRDGANDNGQSPPGRKAAGPDVPPGGPSI